MTAVPCAGTRCTGSPRGVAVEVGVVAQHRDASSRVSSAVVAASSLATGASLTAVTVTVTVPWRVPPLPSLTV